MASLAIAQRSLGDPSHECPLLPVLTTSCPVTSNAEMRYPRRPRSRSSLAPACGWSCPLRPAVAETLRSCYGLIAF